MKLDKLIVTQSGIRSISRVISMIEHVRAGKLFTIECVPGFHCDELVHSLITVVRVPSNIDDSYKYILQDGHHRAISIWLGGRTELHESEYKLIDFADSNMYNQINLRVGWVTPFNVFTQIRYANISYFKQKALSLPPDEAVEYIESHRHEYCHARGSLRYVSDLARAISSTMS